MKFLRNLFALIGLLAIIVVGALFYNIWSATKDFDPNAYSLYKEFVIKLLDTGDLADAFVWAVPVEDGISADEVKDAMKSLAVERNFLFVNESPFYKQAEAVTGETFRISLSCSFAMCV